MELLGNLLDNQPHPASEEADAPLNNAEFVRIQEKMVGESLGANYEGDWTSIFYSRLKHPMTKERFLKFKTRFPTEETGNSADFKPKDDGLSLNKAIDIPMDEYQRALENYDQNIEDVFSSTRYHYAKGEYLDDSKVSEIEFHLKSHAGASAGYGDRGSVFIDATNKNGVPLSSEEKKIVEAHEKAHGIFGHLTNGEKKYIWNIFDNAKIGYPYKQNSEEILVRLTQLKNYYGFRGDEPMTVARLRYAKAHYVEDVGLDNNMSQFLGAITPNNEQAVVDLMNEYPC